MNFINPYTLVFYPGMSLSELAGPFSVRDPELPVAVKKKRKSGLQEGRQGRKKANK